MGKERGTKRRWQSERAAPMKPARANGAKAVPVDSGARDAKNGPQKRAVSIGQADAERVLHRGMTPPDHRPRRERLMELLEYAHVIGASPAELKLDGFVCVHGRNPDTDEGSALGLTGKLHGKEESFPPYPECQPRYYLETVAETMRTEPEFIGPLAKLPDWGGPQVVARFLYKLAAAKRRKEALLPGVLALGLPTPMSHDELRGLLDEGVQFFWLAPTKLSRKDILLCGLLALGLPTATAHDWLKGLPDEDSSRWHLVCFVAERCLLPCAPWGRACKVTTAALFGAYLQWCKGCPRCQGDRAPYLRCESATGVRLQWCAKAREGLGSEKPYSLREFSTEIGKCGGVERKTVNGVRGFWGIALR